MNWRGTRDPGARAERLRVRPWTDPRVLLGVVLVLAATVLGARVAAAADDSVQYWSLDTDVRAGDPVTRDQLVATDVRLSRETAARYLAVADELPASLDDLVWRHDLARGGLLERDALAPSVASDQRELPLLVADGATPPDLARGDVVEVWVGPGPGDDAGTPASQVLAAARVVRSGGGSSSFDGGSRTIVVEVPADALTGQVVATVAAGHVTLVRQP